MTLFILENESQVLLLRDFFLCVITKRGGPEKKGKDGFKESEVKRV